jgi:hypothetical protein
MANCEGTVWRSTVKKKVTGTIKEKAVFEITKEEANGNFTGRFQSSSGGPEDIKGNCSASHLWFVKPNANPVLRYEGDVSGSGTDKRIDGERSELGVTLKEERQSKLENEALAGPDDWISEQGTTFATEVAKL